MVANGNQIPAVNNLYSLGNTSNRWIGNMSDLSVANTLSLPYGAVDQKMFSHANTTVVTVDSFLTSAYRSAEYLVQISDGSNRFQISKLLVVHDGTASYMTEYGIILSSTLAGTITSDISGGSVRLRVTPTAATAVTKITRVAVTV